MMTRHNSDPIDADDSTGAFQDYHLTTEEDGSISGHCVTNDNHDLGVPNEYAEWSVRYRHYDEMASRTGLSHVGISGVVVTVYLDGKRLERARLLNNDAAG